MSLEWKELEDVRHPEEEDLHGFHHATLAVLGCFSLPFPTTLSRDFCL